MRVVKFGIIGLGLMGREFAGAAARWCHLPEADIRPEIVAVCSRSLTPQKIGWYTRNFPAIKQVTSDYKELLDNPEVEAVYIAVPHNLHEKFYCEAIKKGKHLMGEKPFGIDLQANTAILECMESHPDVLVRCASQFMFIPAVQRIGKMIEEGVFGRIIEAEAGFLHSSDLDPDKPINWKRTILYNGEYGCMGDLGMHVLSVPVRAGWTPVTVSAVLSNIMTTRPDGKGERVPCETWDNAVLLCVCADPTGSADFPFTLKTFRIAPGEKNTWYIRILGTKACVRYSTKNTNSIEILQYSGGEQAWQSIDMGHEMTFKSVTGPIFESGFSDWILQMWASYMFELGHRDSADAFGHKRFARCVTPEETAVSHRLFTASLRSHREKSTVAV